MQRDQIVEQDGKRLLKTVECLTAGGQSDSYRQLQQLGYVVARQILATEHIDALRQRIANHLDRLASTYLTPFERSRPQLDIATRLNQVAKTDFGYGQSLLNAVLADSYNDPMIGKLTETPALKELIDSLLPGYRISGVTTRIRACIADYQKFHTDWHQDLADPRRTTGDCHQLRLTCWVPLGDVDGNSGALAAAPGHYQDSIMQRRGDGRYHITDTAALEEQSQVFACRKGDVVLMDRFLPHKTLPIQPGSTRWAIASWIKAEPAMNDSITAR
jgi:hypothetical protein